MIRTYKELSQLKSFKEKYEYLKLNGTVGESTFGFDRILNQKFYHSEEYLAIRAKIIVRDNGCDLGCEDRPIPDGVPIYIHHMNPITVKDIEDATDFLLNENYLIATTKRTHDAIHYGDENLLAKEPIERTKNDTCPWKQNGRKIK